MKSRITILLRGRFVLDCEKFLIHNNFFFCCFFHVVAAAALPRSQHEVCPLQMKRCCFELTLKVFSIDRVDSFYHYFIFLVLALHFQIFDLKTSELLLPSVCDGEASTKSRWISSSTVRILLEKSTSLKELRTKVIWSQTSTLHASPSRCCSGFSGLS